MSTGYSIQLIQSIIRTVRAAGFKSGMIPTKHSEHTFIDNLTVPHIDLDLPLIVAYKVA